MGACSTRSPALSVEVRQLPEHAPCCERDLHGPGEPPLFEDSDVSVLVKHRGHGPAGIAGSVHTLPHHPFDVVGWDGCLYPYFVARKTDYHHGPQPGAYERSAGVESSDELAVMVDTFQPPAAR
jgi:homogentisate 1,2-dioxygenase